ncbi:MAG TPA: SEC-C domain-containing protein [Myxococcota bacterium]
MAAYTNDELYGPCPCGSGKKLKFCCKDGLVRRPVLSEAREIELAIDEANSDNLPAGRARLQKLVDANSNEVMVHAVLASMHAAAGDDDDAIVRARAALQLVPGHVATAGLLAHLLAVRGEVVEANAILDRVLKAQIKDGRDATAVVRALGVLERDADIVALCSGLFGQMTHLLAWAHGVAALNLGDKDTAIRLLMASLQDRFDDLGAILLQVARGIETAPVVPWSRHGVLHPATWLPAERTLAALEALEERTEPLGDAGAELARSGVLAQALRQLALTALETDDTNGVTNVAATMAMLSPSIARRELQLVTGSTLGSAEARAIFAAALLAVPASSSNAAGVVVDAGPVVAPVVAAPVVDEVKLAPVATPIAPVASAPTTLSLFDAPAAKPASTSTLPTPAAPVGQFNLFGEPVVSTPSTLPTPASTATSDEPKAPKAKKPAGPRSVERDAPAAAWYEGSSIGELRRFLDAFGVDHDGIKKKSELLALFASAIEDGDLVVDIVNELREHEDLYDVTDALIDAGGFVDLEDMTKRFGVPKDGDELSDLDMLLANGLAVQAIVDGKASIALPTPIRNVLCEATREEA